jgi:hypothetical protein
MTSFSKRMGIIKPRSIIQIDDIDQILRIAIWNQLTIYIWKQWAFLKWDSNKQDLHKLIISLWTDYFSLAIDEFQSDRDEVLTMFKRHVLEGEWFEVYDFIEFVAKNYSDWENNESKFTHACNLVMERELAGYRFINGEITPIINELEIEALESTLSLPDMFKPVKVHIAASLRLLSDRHNPDYRNSIKESISAVESLCCIMTLNPKATLGKALNRIESALPLHGSLKSAFNSLYGYTSDADGIRHGLMDDQHLRQEDAIYMLVSCSAFVNYLINKMPN